MAKGKGFFNKQRDDALEAEVDSIDDLVGEETEVVEGYDGTAFYPIFNEEKKVYEMLLIRLNKKQKRVVNVEIETTRYEIEPRALQDTIKRLIDEIIPRRK